MSSFGVIPARLRDAGEGESVYTLIPHAPPPSIRPPMHRSKYPYDTHPTASTFGNATITTTQTANLAGDYQVKPTNHRYQAQGKSFGPKNVK